MKMMKDLSILGKTASKCKKQNKNRKILKDYISIKVDLLIFTRFHLNLMQKWEKFNLLLAWVWQAKNNSIYYIKSVSHSINSKLQINRFDKIELTTKLNNIYKVQFETHRS